MVSNVEWTCKIGNRKCKICIHTNTDKRIKKFPDAWDAYCAVDVMALVRFGRWKELLAKPLPEEEEVYRHTITMHHYGYCIAHAVLGHTGKAEDCLKEFETAASKVNKERYLHNVPCTDIINIARCMANGELCYRKKQYEKAWEWLEKGIKYDDALPYDEPWGWMQPVRHAYGALLAEQGLYDRARVVYEQDLKQYPKNVWSLSGLDLCLKKLNINNEHSKEISSQLEHALKYSDQ
eukprot:UN31811